MSINVELSTGDELTSLVNELNTLETKVLRRISREVLPPIERELQRIIADYTPPKPDYPIKWKSDRQRKYVMALLRRTNNLPYKRTGLINRSWQIEAGVKGGTVSVSATNTSPYARYVYFPDQQPYLTKWGDPRDKLLDAMARVETGVVEAVDKEIARLK